MAKHFNRREFRRVPFGDIGNVTYPARVREEYAQDLLSTLDVEGDPRAATSASSSTTGTRPRRSSCRSCSGRSGSRPSPRTGSPPSRRRPPSSLRESIGQAKRLVGAIGAELGRGLRPRRRAPVRRRRAGPRDPGRADAAAVRAADRRGGVDRQGGRPGDGHEPRRGDRRAVRPRGRAHARGPGGADARPRSPRTIVFAGAVGGVYIFPKFLPGYDAVASLCTLLELLARVERPLSELVAELPGLARRPPPDRLPVGAEGPRDARARRAAEGSRARPDRRDQGARRARAGSRCCPTRTSRSSTSTRRATTRRPRPSSRRSCTRSSTRRWTGQESGRRGANLKLRLNLCPVPA